MRDVEDKAEAEGKESSRKRRRRYIITISETGLDFAAAAMEEDGNSVLVANPIPLAFGVVV